MKPKIEKLITRATLQQRPKWSRLAEETSSYVKPRFRLGDYFTIKRGIATGDNSFFMLERERIEQLKLSIEFFRPILPSPRHLKSDEVRADADGNPKLEPNLFVLNCRLSEQSIRENHPNLWHYLKSGKSTVGERYLCRSRTPWYSQEEREPAPFLCTYMGRGRAADKKPFRFILNRSKAIAANTYLMLYPKQRLQNAINRDPAILHEIWKFLREISTTDMQSEGRVYGGGLYKMEPKELCNVNAEALEKMTGDSSWDKYTQLDLLSVTR